MHSRRRATERGVQSEKEGMHSEKEGDAGREGGGMQGERGGGCRARGGDAEERQQRPDHALWFCELPGVPLPTTLAYSRRPWIRCSSGQWQVG
ncbi:hypothetical protein CLOM_g366 [Closterium sp. NIES-68]|nr:hypothetical protein CLOM_g366 [Closterium sp. NIES-68]GJP81275.1 hypothetical protein CLOP_g11434 [Closterium sp. NIES-67]